jgi:hypothetical protein
MKGKKWRKERMIWIPSWQLGKYSGARAYDDYENPVLWPWGNVHLFA